MSNDLKGKKVLVIGHGSGKLSAEMLEAMTKIEGHVGYIASPGHYEHAVQLVEALGPQPNVHVLNSDDVQGTADFIREGAVVDVESGRNIVVLGDLKTAPEDVREILDQHHNFERRSALVEPLEFRMPQPIEMPFVPKAKHCPKGHERPYKYHR